MSHERDMLVLSYLMWSHSTLIATFLNIITCGYLNFQIVWSVKWWAVLKGFKKDVSWKWYAFPISSYSTLISTFLNLKKNLRLFCQWFQWFVTSFLNCLCVEKYTIQTIKSILEFHFRFQLGWFSIINNIIFNNLTD